MKKVDKTTAILDTFLLDYQNYLIQTGKMNWILLIFLKNVLILMYCTY